MKKHWLLLLLSLSPALLFAKTDQMKAFPPAEAGMTRHVLTLPEQADESSYKVELIVGKTVKVDDSNRYFFGGEIKPETIQGWGYTRYVVSKLGPMAGTLMAVNPDAPKVDKFVAMHSRLDLIRYNSRLPVVVYAPEGVEVRYRVWSAPPEAQVMNQG